MKQPIRSICQGQGHAKQPIRSVCQGQVKRSSQSKAFAKDKSIVRTNQVAFTKKRRKAAHPIRFVWQEARRTPRHTRRKHRPDQLEPSVGLSSVGLSSDGLSLDGPSSDGPSIKSESSDKPIGSIGRIIFGRTIFGRTFFGRTFLSVRDPKIGTSHKCSWTARVTRSTSPLEYDTSSKETVGNGGRSRSTRKSRTFTCALSRYTRKSRMFTCALSRYTRRSRTFTCTVSRTMYVCARKAT